MHRTLYLAAPLLSQNVHSHEASVIPALALSQMSSLRPPQRELLISFGSSQPLCYYHSGSCNKMLSQKALSGSGFPRTHTGLVCHIVLKSPSRLAVDPKDEGQGQVRKFGIPSCQMCRSALLTAPLCPSLLPPALSSPQNCSSAA